MSKLPRDVPARKVISALERLGFQIRRVSGSHYVMVKGNLRTVIPYHAAVKTGTLKSILNQINMTVEEFIELL